MKRKLIVALSLALALAMVGCGTSKEEIIGGADYPTSIELKADNEEESEKEEPETQKEPETQEEATTTPLTDDEALTAIRNYCFETNPDLKDIVSEADYPAYWEVVSSDANEIVVLFRSYTGAQVRYYIDPVSGDTYVTEFVPGITENEEKTDENFNARDYLAE